MQRQRTRNEQPYLKLIDYIFYNEKLIREGVAELRLQCKTTEIKNVNNLADPTAILAVKNLTPLNAITLNGRELKKPEQWLEVVDKTYKWCNCYGYYEAVRRRYCGEHFLKICMELYISEKKFYYILDKARNYATLQAVQLGLLHID